MQRAADSFIFVGLDCAYRSLGWCVMRFNPDDIGRNTLQYLHGGVEDVLRGRNIVDVDAYDRAKALNTSLISIGMLAQSCRREPSGRELGSHNNEPIIIIIEKQPRAIAHGKGRVHDANQTIEAQIMYHFTAVQPVSFVYLIKPIKKNLVASRLLCEPKPLTYPARKSQSRRAFAKLAQIFAFDAATARIGGAAVCYKNTPDDLADACMQIIAAIFLCSKDIQI